MNAIDNEIEKLKSKSKELLAEHATAMMNAAMNPTADNVAKAKQIDEELTKINQNIILFGSASPFHKN